MGARILFRDSQGRDGSVDLVPHTPVYVGRGLDCAIRTDDAMVSRKHSMIKMDGGRFCVEDLGSSNGTHVNDTRVSKQALNHNDVVRCGSLWLRYVEDGPLMSAAPAGQTPAAPNKPGTQPLPGSAGGGGAYGGAGGGGGAAGGGGAYGGAASAGGAGASPYSPPGMPGGGGAPAMPGGGAPAMPGGGGAQPFGGPPGMPGGGGPPAMPGAGGPPVMPGGGGAQPFGGPPGMPGGGGPPAMPDLGGAIPVHPSPSESSVVVDMGASPDVEKARKELDAARTRAEELQANYDREVADGKRMRAESITLKERIDEMRGQLKDRDDQVAAHNRVAEELREELNQTKDELTTTRGHIGEIGEDVTARERQLSRAQDDIGKLKQDVEDSNRQLAELSKTKDEGWRKLNEQLTEIEHLREVINEQERMLEERRVGLVSQEEVIKELRADKEKMIKEMASIRAERDEALANEGRFGAQIQAVDEENRRLSRMLVESQSGGASQSEVDHSLRLATEAKELKVELKKAESDNERIEERLSRAEKDLNKVEEENAQLQVDLREAVERRQAALSQRTIAEEALAKAELARHKAAEEALEASKAKEDVASVGEGVRREADKLRRQVKELEDKLAASGGAADSDDLKDENDSLQRKLREAEGKAGDLQRSLGSIQAELDLAKAEAKAARHEAENAAAASASGGGGGGDAAAGNEIRERATEVYESINDILSEIRNNLMIIQGEFTELAKEATGDSVSIISDTIETLVGSAEDAKGVVRGLREVIEFG
jgi:predicted  nucleic acid-binding Zn-ribbon protein